MPSSPGRGPIAKELSRGEIWPNDELSPLNNDALVGQK
jgi:hypothetical protein